MTRGVLVAAALSLLGVNFASATFNCGDAKAGPVLSGIDMVDAYNNKLKGIDAAPSIGDSSITSTVDSDYEFWFLNEENKAIFDQNSTQYIPFAGGYCAWGMTGEDTHCSSNPDGCTAAVCLLSSQTYEIGSDGQLYWFLGPGALRLFNQNEGDSIDRVRDNLEKGRGENMLCLNTDHFSTRNCPN